MSDTTSFTELLPNYPDLERLFTSTTSSSASSTDERGFRSRKEKPAGLAQQPDPFHHSRESSKASSSPFFGGRSSYYKSEPQVLKEFTVFLELPLELRQKIWQSALHPRVLPIFIKNQLRLQSYWDRSNHRQSTTLWRMYCNPPALLFCCVESRIEALRMYTLCFAEQFGSPIYFSPHNDILLFMSSAPAMTAFFGMYTTVGADKLDRSLVRNVACLGGVRASESMEKWFSERECAVAKSILSNLDLFMLVSLGEKELDRVILNELTRHDGIVIKAFENSSEATELPFESRSARTMSVSYQEKAPVQRPSSQGSSDF
ncbi:hypothetical protein B0O99DRAFT_202414 [Bisporella sp. PMI_857]|nr:hypothetical protein B0O99DRAFT_202414 [Bisporella sp. PMI_857]